MNNWQTMESAPRDGTYILCHGMGIKDFPMCWDIDEARVPAQAIVKWVEAFYDAFEPIAGTDQFKKVQKTGYAYWSGPSPHAFAPSHWMPLPDPPADTKP